MPFSKTKKIHQSKLFGTNTIQIAEPIINSSASIVKDPIDPNNILLAPSNLNK